MIKETESPQVKAAPQRLLHPLHLDVRDICRDAVWTCLEAPEGTDARYLLYRFYDAEGLPLYIGKTTTGTARLEQHRRYAKWYALAEFVALSFYPDHARLLRAERAAIRCEQPRFNVTDRNGRRRVVLDLHGPVKAAALEILDEASPEFTAELARILSTPAWSLQAAAPPGPEWDDSYDLTPEEQAQLAADLAVMDEQHRWARDTTDLWRIWLEDFGHRQPTVDEDRAFHGRLIAEARNERLDRRRLRLMARGMAEFGSYDIDEVIPRFLEERGLE